MSSIKTVNKSNLEYIARAAEAEFKRAMEDADASLADLLTPALSAKTAPSTIHNFDDIEVNYRPTAQQWTVRTP